MRRPGEGVERRNRFRRPRVRRQSLVRGLLRLGVLAGHRRGLGQGQECWHPNRPLGIAIRKTARRPRRLRVLLQIEVGPRQLQECLLYQLPLGMLLEELGVRLDGAGRVARLKACRSKQIKRLLGCLRRRLSGEHALSERRRLRIALRGKLLLGQLDLGIGRDAAGRQLSDLAQELTRLLATGPGLP